MSKSTRVVDGCWRIGIISGSYTKVFSFSGQPRQRPTSGYSGTKGDPLGESARDKEGGTIFLEQMGYAILELHREYGLGEEV